MHRLDSNLLHQLYCSTKTQLQLKNGKHIMGVYIVKFIIKILIALLYIIIMELLQAETKRVSNATQTHTHTQVSANIVKPTPTYNLLVACY